MFEQYFCPRVASRFRASPDADWLASFLRRLHDRGYSRSTVQTYLRQAELFGRWLRRRHRSLADATGADGHAFAARAPRCTFRHGTRAALTALIRQVRGLVPQDPVPACPAIERAVADYDAHLRDAAGLAPATRLYRRRYAREFLRSVFGDGPIRWTRLRPDHLRTFVAGYGGKGRVAAAGVAASAVRSLLRWLQLTGRVGPDLIAAVPHCPHWRLASLPPTLSDDQVMALLARFPRCRCTSAMPK
jgi:integrase/recombinase XerD